MTASPRPFDEVLLRRAFDVAKAAREAGDHPFGAVLADEEGKFLIEQGGGFASEGDDRTGHAQRLLASRAARLHSLGVPRKIHALQRNRAPCDVRRRDSTGPASGASSTA